MLSGHHYWNFEAYQESDNLDAVFVQFASSKYVETNGDLIPTGVLGNIAGTPLDFNVAKSLGDSINATAAGMFCGTGKLTRVHC